MSQSRRTVYTRVSVHGSVVRMTLVFKFRPLPCSVFHSLLWSISISSLKKGLSDPPQPHIPLSGWSPLCSALMPPSGITVAPGSTLCDGSVLWTCRLGYQPRGFLFQVDTHTFPEAQKNREGLHQCQLYLMPFISFLCFKSHRWFLKAASGCRRFSLILGSQVWSALSSLLAQNIIFILWHCCRCEHVCV